MIRFIDLSDQIQEGQKAFAFFNTVTDSFVSFNYIQVFYSVREPKEACEDISCRDFIDRCINLIPGE